MSQHSESDTVPRLHRPEPAVFQREFVARARPAVLTGVMDDWPAMERWCLAYFADRFGDEPLRIHKMAPQDAGDERDPWRRLRQVEISMRAYIEAVTTSLDGSHYVAGMPLAGAWAALREDIVAPPYVGAGPQTPRLWFGGGLAGPLHYDTTNILHGIISGAKQVTLLSPDQRRYIYPHAVTFEMPHMSRTTVRAADYANFPLVRKARPLRTALGKGDLLFIPRGWWHEVDTPQITISVDHSWRAAPSLEWNLIRLWPNALTTWYRRNRRSRAS